MYDNNGFVISDFFPDCRNLKLIQGTRIFHWIHILAVSRRERMFEIFSKKKKRKEIAYGTLLYSFNDNFNYLRGD